MKDGGGLRKAQPTEQITKTMEPTVQSNRNIKTEMFRDLGRSVGGAHWTRGMCICQPVFDIQSWFLFISIHPLAISAKRKKMSCVNCLAFPVDY